MLTASVAHWAEKVAEAEAAGDEAALATAQANLDKLTKDLDKVNAAEAAAAAAAEAAAAAAPAADPAADPAAAKAAARAAIRAAALAAANAAEAPAA